MTDTQADKSSENQNYNYCTYTKKFFRMFLSSDICSDHMLSTRVECSAHVQTVKSAFLNKNNYNNFLLLNALLTNKYNYCVCNFMLIQL